MIATFADVLITFLPPGFILAGLLAAGHRLMSERRGNINKKVDVDPTIRVRVTGKIS